MAQWYPALTRRRVFFSAVAFCASILGATRLLSDPIPEPLERWPTGTVLVKGAHPDRAFKVWLATTDSRREQGLMYVRSLAADQGMLFVFEQPDLLTFWMKNTYVPLDLLYIRTDGHVVRIAENATPLSLTGIPSGAPANQVLEIGGGVAHSLGLVTGDRVVLQAKAH